MPGGAAAVPTIRRITYGDGACRFGELSLPPGDAPVPGTVVVVHGGFWRAAYGLELGRPLAADLVRRGWAVWNVEYRRVGGPGADAGGWPATFEDVAVAVDALAGPVAEAASGRIDPTRVVAVGHSAGGHLAAWLAARPGLPDGAPGAAPAVVLLGAVSQAGVLDLDDGARQGLGAGAIQAFLGGGPDEVPQRYALGSPIERVPFETPVVCVHGTADDRVPIRQGERFAAAAGAELVRLPGVDHFAVIDPATDAWRACRDAAERLLG